MRKLINELTDHFGGVSIAAGDKSKADLAPLPLRGILLVDCDGTLFDVAGQSENTALFDTLIAACTKGYAVVIHSGDRQHNTHRVNAVLNRRGINQDYWIHANKDGESQLVWDKMDSRKVVENLDPTETMPLLIIDDEAGFAKTMVKIYNIIGYKAQSILPTDIAALKTFAKIAEFEVEARHASLEASI